MYNSISKCNLFNYQHKLKSIYPGTDSQSNSINKVALITFGVLTLFTSQALAARLDSKDVLLGEAIVGVTNNANYEKTQKDSDIFYALSARANLAQQKFDLLAGITLKDYMSESQNDVVRWHVGPILNDILKKSFDSELALTVGGQHYIKEAPGQIEENFDFVFLDGNLFVDIPIKSNLELYSGAGLEVRRYQNFDGRSDVTLYFDNELKLKISPQQTVKGSLNIGFTGSSNSLYSNRYLEWGAGYDHLRLIQKYNFEAKLRLRSTSYPNRTITQETAVSRRRGNNVTVQSRTIELIQNNQILIGLNRDFGPAKGSGQVVWNTQSSRSGVAEYSEVGINFSLSREF